MKKKSTQKTTQNQTMTTTPNNPEFVTRGVEDLSNKVNSVFGAIDPTKYVAGPTDLMKRGLDSIGGLSSGAGYGMGQAMVQDAGSAGPQTVNAGSISDLISSFKNPYDQQVVETSLASNDFAAGKQRGQAQLDLAQDSVFGGSSGSLYKSALEGELARQRGSLEAGLRSGSYDRAVQAATAQAGLNQGASLANANFGEAALNRRLQAGTSLADIAGAQGADARANAGLQLTAGEQERQIQNQQNSAGVDLLLKQIAANSGIPYDLLRGSTSTGTMSGTTKTTQSGAALSDWLNFFAANAQAAAAAGGSDFRLKDNIETTHYDGQGRRWVNFTYKGAPETVYNGVIAQEVRETDPGAVIEGPAGILFVNYEMLGSPMREVA